MPTVINEILFILLLVIANGIFAMSELAIVSAQKSRLQSLANQGNYKASVALQLAKSPTRFLSTVQVGITLIGIAAGALGGATLSEKLRQVLSQVRFLAPYSQPLSISIVILGITYLSLIIGELVPKRLAMSNPEQIAAMVAIPMRMLSNLAYPLVHLLTNSTEIVLKVLGIGAPSEPQVTEEEIKVLLRQGTEEGTFEAEEQTIVERVFQLGDQRVSAMMTPRLDIVWLDLDDALEKNCRLILEDTHSRFPVCQGQLDNVLGILHVNDLLNQLLDKQPIDLTSRLQDPLFVPESTRVLKILELFKQAGTHLALVVDEYGILQGLVTLNDVLEAIVGNIASIDEDEGPQIVQREDGSWLVDGMMPIGSFKAIFNIREFNNETKGNYNTLGGFIIQYLGRIPMAADHFEWGGFRFEVVDMDGTRVDKVLIVALCGQA
jgi:putative hemolysin